MLAFNALGGPLTSLHGPFTLDQMRARIWWVGTHTRIYQDDDGGLGWLSLELPFGRCHSHHGLEARRLHHQWLRAVAFCCSSAFCSVAWSKPFKTMVSFADE